jgi:hypothetical protein
MKIRRLYLTISLAINGLTAYPAMAQETSLPSVSTFKTNDQVPAGFEDLYDQPRIVYYSLKTGRFFLGEFAVQVQGNTLKVLDHARLLTVLNKAHPLNAVKVEILRDAISLSLRSTSVCVKAMLAPCGDYLQDQSVAYLLDEQNASIDITINPDLLLIRDDYLGRDNKFLSDSTTNDFSFLQNINLTYAGKLSELDETEYAANIVSVGSVGNHRLNLNWNINDNGLDVRRFNFEQDVAGWVGRYGYITSNSQGYSSGVNKQLFGFHLGQSKNMRREYDEKKAKPLVITLNSDAMIKIYDKDNLIYAQDHALGTHQLQLPQLRSGSYDLRIVITDIQGNTHEERRRFIKSAAIPLDDEWLWSFDLGYETETTGYSLPDIVKDSPVGRASLLVGFGGNLGFYNEFSYFDDRFEYSPALMYLYGDHTFNAGITLNNEGLASQNLDWQYQGEQHNFYLSHYDIYDQGRSTSMGYNLALGDNGTVNAGCTDNGGDSRLKCNIGYANSVYSGRHGNLTMDIGYHHGEENFFNIGFRYNFRETDRSYSVSNRYSSDKNKHQRSASVTHRNGAHNYNGALESTSGLRTKTMLSHRYQTDEYGESMLNMTHGQYDDKKIRFNGHYRFNQIVKSGDVMIGGKDNTLSGVYIDLSGSDAKGNFLVKGLNKSAKISAGERKFFTLSPYKEYLVSLESTTDNAFVKVLGGMERVVLYPGNVAHLNWKVSAYQLMFARFLDEEGAPISAQLIMLGDDAYYTDDQGFAEIQLLTDTLFITMGDYHCDVSAMARDVPVIYQQDVTCFIRKDDVESAPILSVDAHIVDKIMAPRLLPIVSKQSVSTISSEPLYTQFEDVIVIVQRGDSLTAILERFDNAEHDLRGDKLLLAAKRLSEINRLVNQDVLHLGQHLMIPQTFWRQQFD